MSRYDEEQMYGAGRSRARGGSKAKSGSSARGGASRGSSSHRGSSHGSTPSRSSSGGSKGRGTSSRSTSSRGGGSHYGGTGHGTGHGKGHKKARNDYRGIAVGGVLLIAAVTLIVFLIKGTIGKENDITSESETTSVSETELQKEVMVDKVNITGMSLEEAKEAILKDYPWGMVVTWKDETYEVSDLMAGKVDELLKEIYSGEPKEKYSLNTEGLEEAAAAEAAKAAEKWDKAAKNGSISSYDKENDKFLFTGAEQGLALDQEKLTKDILAALKKKDFDASIAAAVNPVEPEFSEETAKEKYKTISSFTTKTTSNSKRNTNVKLSAEAINGTVLQPGEEFSFNETVGQRTEAKGYKGAAAYNNGEVVEEIGGGVCQTSSTLYNAVVQAGLKTTKRQSHTYEPSYVRPGSDATVSWNGPDYRFVNNSSAAIGIRARYSDQTITVSIYGVPVLEEGVTYALKSKKLRDIDPPAPTYEEDPTLEPGVEKVKSEGSKGSYWETRLEIKKGDEVISQEVDHVVTYRGHAPVVLRNTSGSVVAPESLPEESTIDPNQPSSVAPEGAGDGFTPGTGNNSGSSGGGPGGGGSGNTGNSVGEAPGGGSMTTQTQPEATTPVPVPTTSSVPSAPTSAQQAGSSESNPPMVVPMPGN